jgi:FtsH-binding integral membrane protein
MNGDDDKQLSHLLQTLAPPERDALFRIKVLERRERREFIRRVALLLGAGVLAVVAYVLAATAGGTNQVARGLGLAVAGVMAAAMYLPALLKAVRGMRR